MKKRKKLFIIFGIILIVLIAFRLYLPTLAKDQLNKQLNSIEGYSGGVERVSMQLIRGAFQLHRLSIFEEASSDPSIPLVDLHHADISIHWGALLRGRLVSEIFMDSLIVNFTQREKAAEDENDRIDLAARLLELNPIDINVIQIKNSEITYIDPTTNPQVNIYMADLFFEVKNLRNVVHKKDTLPSTMILESRILNSGRMKADARLNIMRTLPDFEIDLKFENVELTEFNDFTEAYANFTFHEGTLDLFSEIAALDGEVKGYVKPVIEDLEITPSEEDAGFLKKVYEGFLDVIAKIFTNPDTEFLGTQVEFQGRIDDPDVEVWKAVTTLFRNAFFESISKGFEDVIDFEELKK